MNLPHALSSEKIQRTKYKTRWLNESINNDEKKKKEERKKEKKSNNFNASGKMKIPTMSQLARNKDYNPIGELCPSG